MQHDGLVEVAQVIDVARDDGCAFSTCRENDGGVDYVRRLALAAENPHGFGEHLIAHHQAFVDQLRCIAEVSTR